MEKNNKTTKKIVMLVVLVVIILALAVLGILFLNIARNDRDVKRHIDKAEKYLLDMEFDDAIAELEAAIEIAPKKEETYHKLADAYMAKADYLIDEDDFDGADDCYDRAIRVLKNSRDYFESDDIEEYIDKLKDLKKELKELEERKQERDKKAAEEALAAEEAEAAATEEAAPAATEEAAPEYLLEEPLDEPNTDVYEVLGAAALGSGSSIILTPPNFYCSGAVWCDEMIDTSRKFSVELDICADEGSIGTISEDFINGKTTGADGFVINFSPEILVGSTGTEMGFSGYVGVELDSYPFGGNDPEEQHVALINGSTTNHVASAMCGPINDDRWHHVKITYDGGNFEVYFDSAKAFSGSSDLENEVYIGVTAATGSACNRHMIKNFKITR